NPLMHIPSVDILYRLAIVLSVAILSCQSAIEQTQPHRLEGIVLEVQSGESMSDVLVTNIQTDASTRTDREGRFAIAASLDDLLYFDYSGFRVLTVVDFGC